MRIKLLELDTRLHSGRKYPAEKVQEAIDKLVELNPNYMLGVVEEAIFQPTIEDSVGVLQDLRIEDGFLTGELCSIEDKLDKFANKFIVIRPIGVADWDDDGVLTNYLISSAVILAKDEVEGAESDDK